MLPDFRFYQMEYKGNQIQANDFARLIQRAESYLLSLDCDMSKIPTQAMQYALCAVAEAWQTNEQGGDLTAQSVGSWSKSFAHKKPKTDEQRLFDAAQLYIGKYCNTKVRWC